MTRIRTILTTTFFYALSGLLSFAYAQTTQGLQNPLSSDFSTVPAFIAGALKVVVLIALPIISFFIVYSGFLFVSARGNQEKISTAKSNFVYVIIGAILILGAWVIATLIGGTVSQLTGSGSSFNGVGASPY